MSIESQIKAIIATITAKQSDILKKNILVTFLAGWKQSGNREPLSTLQKEQIAKIYKEQMGYISKTNLAVAESMTTEIKNIIKQGGSQEDIRKGITSYITDVFGDKGIEIDNIGKTRIEYVVSKDGTIRAVEKTITKKYGSTIKNYSDVTAKTVSHGALEEGRAAGYQKQGLTHWVFSGPGDERARVSHIAVLGQVFEYGTKQSEMGMALLREPRCRHRALPYFGDPELDSPPSRYEKLKEDAGLFWNDEKEQWSLPESEA